MCVLFSESLNFIKELQIQLIFLKRSFSGFLEFLLLCISFHEYWQSSEKAYLRTKTTYLHCMKLSKREFSQSLYVIEKMTSENTLHSVSGLFSILFDSYVSSCHDFCLYLTLFNIYHIILLTDFRTFYFTGLF